METLFVLEFSLYNFKSLPCTEDRGQTDNTGLDEFQTGALFSAVGMKLSDTNSFI